MHISKYSNLHIPFGKIAIAILIALGFLLLSLYDYLLFHISVELLSIAISLSIFMLTWNARKFMANNYLLLFGIASLFIAILDFLHLTSFPGMPLFTDYGTNLTVQLWLSARFMQAITLLIAPLFLTRRIRPFPTLALYAVITLILLDIIFAGFLPEAFTQQGLTHFKIISEILICLILAGAVFFLYRKRKSFDTNVYWLLIVALILMILSELSLTLYESAQGMPNLVGHLFKAAEFCLIYLAIIHTGLKKPQSLLFKQLHDSNRLKDIFVDIMGHDMLNPAGAVKIRAQLALSKEDDPKRREYLQFIFRESSRLIEMIENAKKLSKLENQTLDKKKQDIKKIVSGAIKSLEQEKTKKNQKIILKAKDKFIANVNSLIYDVYENILSNAIKYSPENSTINVKIKQTNDFIDVSVSDEGKGIPDKYKESIFKRFSRLEKQYIKGTGLGLAIVKTIVDAHNGQVWIEDNPDGGSVFIVRIPNK